MASFISSSLVTNVTFSLATGLMKEFLSDFTDFDIMIYVEPRLDKDYWTLLGEEVLIHRNDHDN